MTRYTKLEKRHAISKPSGPITDSHVDDDDQTVTVTKPTTTTKRSISTEKEEEEQKQKKEEEKQKKEEEKDKSNSPSPPSSEEPKQPDVNQLAKRAKLLKLKAKKAKTEVQRQKFTEMVRAVEKQMTKMYGSFEYGKGGKLVKQSDSQLQSQPFQSQWNDQSQWNNNNDDERLPPMKRMRTMEDNQDWKEHQRDERREKLVDMKKDKTMCFACRGMGHEARECPNRLDSHSVRLEEGKQQGQDVMVGKETVGICFKCGSTEHTLSKCKKAKGGNKDPNLPFATCFVCGQKGHLSSKCSKNASRGIYPNGGCCNLCSSVEHLAKDCPLSLRRPASDPVASLIVGSSTTSGGGDEDEFHSFARKRAEVENKVKHLDHASKKVVSF